MAPAWEIIYFSGRLLACSAAPRDAVALAWSERHAQFWCFMIHANTALMEATGGEQVTSIKYVRLNGNERVMRAKAIHHSVTIALFPTQGTEAQSAAPVCIQLCKCVLMRHKLHLGSVLSVLRRWWVQTLVRLARRCLSYAFIYKMTCHYGAGENECNTAVWSAANARKRTMAYISGKLFSDSPLLNSGSSVCTHQRKAPLFNFI